MYYMSMIIHLWSTPFYQPLTSSGRTSCLDLLFSIAVVDAILEVTTFVIVAALSPFDDSPSMASTDSDKTLRVPYTGNDANSSVLPEIIA